MSLLFWCIYFGGACAYPDKKLGFWKRACWPYDLGERLAELAWKEPQP